MPAAWPWYERTFTFDFPTEKYPDVIERLRGTPARVEELIRNVPTTALTQKFGGTWSIQENVGHLGDTEQLWSGRVEDMLGGAAVMRPVDVTNAKTQLADHNALSSAEVTARFRRQRMGLVRQLDALSAADFARTSIHPRTQLRMRIVDLCAFAAEHDDYHLARISELRRMLNA
ncbi:MAG: DinB family protein [Planctomycetes bacterium]|nr:DinB family protein [Planctomycetota bacterium]